MITVSLRVAGTHRDITLKKQMELGDQKQRQLLSFINKAMGIYLQDHDLSGACRKVLEELTEIADSEFAFIGQMRKKDGKDVLYIHAITELAWNQETQMLVQMYHDRNLYFGSFDNLFGSVITTEKLVISNHSPKHPASKGTPKGHPKIYKFMGLPIKLQGNLVGMIGLANKLSDYTAEDATFLQPLVDALASLYYSVDQEEARECIEEQLKILAMTDPLTGLLNRRAFEETFINDYRQKTNYVVAILDIDHFKSVNDRYGHPCGDIVLQRIAQLLHQTLKRGDVVARIGGEEFAMLIDSSGKNDAKSLLNALLEQIEKLSITVAEEIISITASIGAVEHILDMKGNIEYLLRHSDVALYQAKHNGRNQVKWGNFASLENNNG
ncbi:sensor domain-containing diguanylate cyclase [Vibrio tritonius]|uniref:sensor domain-containing diguanylate cyclase n=1 Tax=Vibrio tritonius TaxID=1435069 RepID=UPI00315DD9EC